MKKVQWGILGSAKIAREHMIPGMQQGELCEVWAIASRNRKQAQQVAKDFSIPKAYGSYDQLLSDPNVQAVYIPLPNHLHVSWSVKAAEAGKHILCEKPLGIDAADAEKLVAICRNQGVLLMEAFMYRTHPQWVLVKDCVAKGMIGQVKAFQMFFSYSNDDPDNIRNRGDLAGSGGIMDIGCYPISQSRFVFGAEPQRVMSLVNRDPEMKTDVLSSAILDFRTAHATFTCATQLFPYQRVQVLGTKGRLEVEIPVNTPNNETTKIFLSTDKGTETITIAPCHQYQIEADLFSKAIIDGTALPTPPEDAIRNMKVIDALFRSEKSGNWEVV